MDPNKLLSNIRWTVDHLLTEDEPEPIAGWDLAEMVNELDGWLTQGGFLPTDWKKE